MKKLLSLAIALTLVTGVMAQEKREKRTLEKKKHRVERFKDFTPEQMAELRTKQMALKLDLSQAQQKEVLKLNKELAGKRKAGFEKFKEARAEKKEWTAEERFAFMNERLDARLAVQNKMKNILDEDQYARWKRSYERPEKSFRHEKRGHWDK